MGWKWKRISEKVFFIFLVIFIISNSIYAEKGICLDDNVRVRSKPTLIDSSVVGKLNKNEIFEIYGYEGSGEYNERSKTIDYFVECYKIDRDLFFLF